MTDLAYYLALPYHIVLSQDRDADGVYWTVTVPEWPGCEASGRTRMVALRALDTAITNWLISSLEHGDPIPEPEWSV